MHPVSERGTFTYEDLLNFPDDGKRHELIGGEHYVTPSPGSGHQIIAGNLHFLLRLYLRERPLGVVMLAPFDVVLTEIDVVEPDLLYFTGARYPEVVTSRCAQGPPDLAVEILSPGTRRTDELTKRKLYEARGVGEYWVVDPELETIKVYRLAGTVAVPGELEAVGRPQYVRAAELSLENADALTSPLFPDLVLPLAEIFKPA